MTIRYTREVRPGKGDEFIIEIYKVDDNAISLRSVVLIDGVVCFENSGFSPAEIAEVVNELETAYFQYRFKDDITRVESHLLNNGWKITN